MKLYRYLIVLFTIIGLLFIGTGTVSYFVRNVEGTVSATTDNLVLNVTGFDDEVNKVINFGQIAPGSEGEFTLNLNMTGSSNDVIYTVDIERTNLPDNLKFYYDNVHISPFVNCSKFIAYNASSMIDTVIIYWYWDGEVDDENDALFIDENISASISVNVEAQVYGTMKNGYSKSYTQETGWVYNLTEFWSDIYAPYIRTIEFKKSTSEMPNTCDVANLCWDVSDSATQDYHVYAYMVDSGFKNTNTDYTVDQTLYNLYIVCDREIYAPSNSGYLFYDMVNLVDINFNDNFNTSKVTDMRNMFDGCSSLTSLDLSDFNTSKVTDMRNMFNECSSLANLDLINFNTSNVTYMGNMFCDCIGLTSLDVSSFNTSNVTNMSVMFAGCSNLIELLIGNFNTKNVINMGSMFASCSSLTSLDLTSFNTSSVAGTAYNPMHPNSDGYKSNSFQDMFLGCSSLTSLDLSNFNTSNVTRMDGMFSQCSSLTSLDLSNFNTANVTHMGSMFWGCSGLTGLDVNNFNTDDVAVMSSMFRGCSSLTSLDLNNFNTSSVTNMYSMFSGCSKLSTTININDVNTVDYANMFEGAATDASALITVNYTAETSTLVDNMIATKSASSNVVKGTLIS